MSVEPKISVFFDNTEWRLLFHKDVATPKTIYTVGGTLISVYISDDSTIPTLQTDKSEYTTIGGIISTCDTPDNKYVWVRSHVVNGSLYYLPKGQTDPARDMGVLYETITTVNDTLSAHAENYNNVHRTTKTHVELGNIPNRVTDIIPETSTNALLLDSVAITLQQNMQDHINRIDNPHNVTVEHIGLNRVQNYDVATSEADIMDVDNDTMYASIKSIHDAISRREQLTVDIAPHTIVAVRSEVLTTTEQALYNPRALSVDVVGSNVQIMAGLQVTYTHLNRTYLSKVLTTDINIPLSSISTTLERRPGWHYIYVDILTDGTITTAGSTQNRPTFDTSRNNDISDFYDIVTNQVKNLSGTLLRRVYISKLYILDTGEVSHFVNVPKGNRFTMQISTPIVGNTTYRFDNPYFEDIEVIPEIKIGSTWSNPYWNDQVGVMATYTRSHIDKIIVQTGALGLAMIAPSSGNAFTETELSVTATTAVLLRLKIKKVL